MDSFIFHTHLPPADGVALTAMMMEQEGGNLYTKVQTTLEALY